MDKPRPLGSLLMIMGVLVFLVGLIQWPLGFGHYASIATTAQQNVESLRQEGRFTDSTESQIYGRDVLGQNFEQRLFGRMLVAFMGLCFLGIMLFMIGINVCRLAGCSEPMPGDTDTGVR